MISILAAAGEALARSGRYTPTEFPAMLSALFTPQAVPKAAPAPRVPAVGVKSSVTDTYIVSLFDGSRHKQITRHLSANGVTPLEYRRMFDLPADYPMVAPATSRHRSAVAKSIGLGRSTLDLAVEAVVEVIDTVALESETPVEITEVADVIVTEVKAEIDPQTALDAEDEQTSTAADSAFVAEGSGTLPEGYTSVLDTISPEGKLICLLDGKPVAELARHARRHHGVSAAAYRARFGLPESYPMTAQGTAKFKETLAD